ncbi:unnamed protein product [Pipistrellus nathusii]|uniref:Uncharacterized protein n=1 Tax=Pipistrellus nathusii TaxID=59473 RepID=A0ABN9ZZ26_PIPNA
MGNGFVAVLSSPVRKTLSLAHPSPCPLRHAPILGELWALCRLDKFWSLRDPALPLSLPLTPSVIAQLFIKIFLFILFHAVWRRLSPLNSISSHNGSGGGGHGEESLWVPALYSYEEKWVGWRRTAKWLAQVIAFCGKPN